MAIVQKVFITIMFVAVMFISCYVQARNLNETIPMKERYQRWQSEQGRNPLNGAGEDVHFEIFKKNAEYVDKINSEDRLFKLALNKWADTTDEDFTANFGYIPHNTSQTSNHSLPIKKIQYEEVKGLPAYVDWRERGAVTSVKTQGTCGACWAFAAAAAIEGMVSVYQGSLPEVSIQNMIDCVNGMPFNDGCRGGSMISAYNYVLAYGITSEREYPYKGFNPTGNCRKEEKFQTKTTIRSYVSVPNNENIDLMKAVAKQPVSVAVDAHCAAFHQYRSGILTEHCGNRLNHAVTLIGYGEENGNKFWLAKNSWGPGWGEKGFIRLSRNCGIDGGLCGLATQASYPIL